MSKPWGKIGAWADEAELADEEKAAEATATAAADMRSFPSLKEAAIAKSKKKKKIMTLSEFSMGEYGSGSAAVGLTPEEMHQLPTGPRQRSQEEMQPGRLGGGFSSYGRSGGGPPERMMRDRGDSDGSWGGGRRAYGGFDDERRGPSSRVSDLSQPSRADEVDDWGKSKKSLPSFDQGRQSRYGGLGAGGSGGGFSKADEVDNWGAGKRQPPTSTFGSGFHDSGPKPDRWSREVAGVQAERRRLVLEPRKADSGVTETQVVKTNKPSPFGAARPREEVLAEKGLDWKKLDSEIEGKKESSQTSRPTSAHSSRPSSVQSIRSEGSALNSIENAVKPRPKVNPFGDAKPREILLEERGQDWRKIDFELDHRRVDRPETEEEKMLKEEIEELKKQLEKDPAAPDSKASKEEPGGNNNSLPGIISQKEKDLETLARELDDKVRFRQKAVQRPDSSAGRTATYSERSHSRSESFDESRSVESMDRPRSRGAVDAWVRPVDNRRNFQGNQEHGHFSNRNSDRPSSSSSRERW
ncbi:PREDICTED: eukaryotic translation initiation factor 4B2-like [Tarenaya hassleriana]|uniref:eukaryotic translation initiation factor 4B2-like n=1 Tax=Tarenaya hassleriana TaxID=28532 RepID=UPI00053C4775|nr:PREDICTED: eukaryotic translation initiation factor 4B2-like [Tarenaya hassleriana]